jgi:hypothetical protein
MLLHAINVCIAICFFKCFRKLAKSNYYIRHVCLSVLPSAWNNLASTGRIFIKFDIWRFFKNLSSTFKFRYNRTTVTGTLHEDLYALFIISRSFLLRMRNVSDKVCRENKNTHFMFSDFFRKSCRLWDNVEKYCRAGQATQDNMAHAHCILDN